MQIARAVASLKAAGIWAALDVLHVYAAADQQAALINWKQPGTYSATLVNSPSFVPDRGITGDGIASYIDTGFNTALGVNFQQDSASVALWRPIPGGNVNQLGHVAGTTLTMSGTSFRVNQSAASSMPNIGSTAGLAAMNRDGASTTQIYLNGVSQAVTSPQASVAPTSSNLFLGRTGGTYNGTTQFGSFSAGASLTPAQHGAQSNALLAYMQAVGAA